MREPYLGVTNKNLPIFNRSQLQRSFKLKITGALLTWVQGTRCGLLRNHGTKEMGYNGICTFHSLSRRHQCRRYFIVRVCTNPNLEGKTTLTEYQPEPTKTRIKLQFRLFQTNTSQSDNKLSIRRNHIHNVLRWSKTHANGKAHWSCFASKGGIQTRDNGDSRSRIGFRPAPTSRMYGN